MRFGNKKGVDRQIVGFTKARKVLFFTIKPRPIYKENGPAGKSQPAAKENAAASGKGFGGGASSVQAELAASLIEMGMRVSPEAYKSQCVRKAEIIAIAAVVAVGLIVFASGIFVTGLVILLIALIGMAAYLGSYQALLSYPVNRIRAIGKDVEKDILFAARDMIVSMRSGLPLFNAMVTVSNLAAACA